MNEGAEEVWRVFYTTARAEKKCAGRLAASGIEVLLPTYRTVRQWKDRKKKVIEPLFRNYVFARVDEAARLRVLQTPGIVRCVSFGGAPALIRDEEIAQLRRLQEDPDRVEPVDFPLPPPGEEVTIEAGPLRGLRGEVLEHRGQTYLILRVAAIRQALRVKVPASAIERTGHRA